MLELDSAGGDVPVLPAGPAPAAGSELQIVLTKNHLGLRRLWKDRHRDRAGVDPSPLLVGWDPLPAVTSGLVLEGLYRSLAGDPQNTEARTLLYDLRVKDPSEPPA